MVCNIVSIYFDSPQLGLTHFSPVPYFYTPWKRQKTKGLKCDTELEWVNKKTVWNFSLLIRDMFNFNFSENGLEIVSPQLFVSFQEKCFSCYIRLTDQISLSIVAFTSWDIGQYLYSHCLFPRLWRHKFWN